MTYETIEIYNTEDITSIEIINSEDIVTIEISELGSPGIDGKGVPPGGTAGQILSKIDNVDFNSQWIEQSQAGVTDLGYEPTATDGTVISSTGTDAVIPLATNINAGLFSPSEKSNLAQQSGINTGDQDLSGLATTAALDLKAPIDQPVFTGGVTSESYAITNSTGNRLLLDSGNLLETNLNIDTRFLSATGSGEPTGNTPVWELLTKSTVGLSNVDNTSDANKPISTSTQNALNLKVDNNNIVQNTLVYADANDSITEFPNNPNSSLLFLASSDGNIPSWQPVPVSGSLVYYYSNTASDVIGYYKQQIDPVATLEVIQNIDVIDGQLLASWITEQNNPALTSIQAGQYACHVHIVQITGTKSSQIRAEIWETNELGVDISKIADLGASSVISGTNAEYIIADSILEHTLTSAKSRISTKIYAVITGGGSAPHLNIYIGDGYDSRTNFPSPSISASNFLPYVGAVKDVNLGANSITASSFYGNSTTQLQGDNSNKIATTSYVDTGLSSKVSNAITDGVTTVAPSQNAVFDALALKANLASPTFTGNITISGNGAISAGSFVVSGAAAGSTLYLRADGTTANFRNQVITAPLAGFITGAGTVTASDSILQAFQKVDGNTNLKSNLVSPIFTGIPQAPTPLSADNSTTLATTAFVKTVTASSISGITSTGTGTNLPTDKIGGYFGNMQVGDTANSSVSYNLVGNLVVSAFGVVRVNRATQPFIVGATLIDGAAFVANIDMHMVYQYFGTSVQYYFLRL